MTWLDVLLAAKAELEFAGVEGAARDARLLLAHRLGLEAAELIAIERDQADHRADGFAGLIVRRAAGEPVSRIRGWREFHGHRFIVSPAVLDPRPDTEVLVDEALARIGQNARVLDLGTGSGCILLSVLAEHSDAVGVGVDLSGDALAIARINAARLDLRSRVQLVEGGWHAALAHAPFDMLLSNPPYIPSADIPGLDREVRAHDPMLALDGGPDGLAPYRDILALSERLLAPGGWIGFEFGVDQASAVQQLMTAAGLAHVSAHSDLGGRPRAAFGQRL